MLRVVNIMVVQLLVLCTMIATMSLYAQSPEKGIQARSSKDLAQSIGLIQGTRWALLIGIADYPPSATFEIQQLKAPVKDVTAFSMFLMDHQKGGFDADCVFVLMDAEATKRNILMRFNDIAKRAGPTDMVLFYFSGHGYRPSESETTYLIPYDYDMEDYETTCINFDDLSKKIQRMEANKVVVILDACHAGGVKPKGSRSAGITGIAQKFAEAFQKAEGRQLLLSSDEKEVSWETEECGVFTHFLLEGLEGKADTNPKDGVITFSEVASYVEYTVPEYTREKFSQIQNPARRGDLGGQVRGDIPLAINLSEVSRQRQEELRDRRYAAIISSGLDRLDLDIRESSLKIIKSVYSKSVSGEPLTEQESAILPDIDALQAKTITAEEYVERARIALGLGREPERLEPEHPEPATIVAPDLPKDVTVCVNDVPVTLPYTIQAGTHRIRLERDGFQTIEMSVALNPAQVLSLNPTWTPEKKVLTGKLRLRIEPADAKVTISGASGLFNAPTVGEKELLVGTYNVKIERDGYETSINESVKITDSAPTLMELKLEPIPATIAAQDLPKGTRVLVNGVSVTLPYKLPPGTCRIRMERKGFQPVEMSERLTPAQFFTLNPVWFPEKKGIPRIGVYGSIVYPRNDYDSYTGFGVVANVCKVFIPQLRFELDAGYREYFHWEGWESALFNFDATLKAHPFDWIISPYIGIGPTFSIGEHNEKAYGIHFAGGSDIRLGSIMKLTGGVKYYITTDYDVDAIEIIGAMVLRLW